MASMLWRTSLTKSNLCCFALLTAVRATQFSPFVVPKTTGFLGRSIPVGPSARTEKLNVVRVKLVVSVMKKDGGVKRVVLSGDEKGVRTVEITELYNTSQKILIACIGDFSYAHFIASTLGDASNIVVISQYGCVGELEMMYENARSHMLDLTKLGATIIFNVDFGDFAKDNRINHMRFDRIILDLSDQWK